MAFIDHEILARVEKPARYTGNEWNMIKKDHLQMKCKVVLAFPDIYEVGQSNLGYRILYHILNKHEETVAERVYAPWVDMEKELRQHELPLTTLESGTPLKDMDIVGFNMQYEMSYTNILNMMDLGKIPLWSQERGDTDPLIIAGGPAVYNPEPLAEFIDFFIIGEAEEVLIEVAEAFIQWKEQGKPGGRKGVLQRMATLQGIYVPAFYDVTYHTDGRIAAIVPHDGYAQERVHKRVIKDMDSVDYPTRPIVPFVEIVHDRIMLEIFRGCTRGCRFCQAGIIYRPVRERSLEKLKQLVQELVDNTGYQEISLTSLSSSDYSCLRELVSTLNETFSAQGISLSLPSLRIDSFSIKLAEEVQKVRKSGLTFAPEAGTQRMRDVINKGVTEENLVEAVKSAYEAGWSAVKLYFMIGLPTEREEDVKGIADLAYKVLDTYTQVTRKRNGKLTISVSSYVPKPHTPFQWVGQNSITQIEEKQRMLAGLLRDRRISFNWHDAKLSYMEGTFARGDRRMGKVLFTAWKLGCKFDGWSEHFHFDRWMQAFTETGLDPAFYNERERQTDELFPWAHIDAGVTTTFLRREHDAALAGEFTADCRRGTCSSCGVCQVLDVDVVDWGKE